MQPYIWIPVTLLLGYRAWSHSSLTPAGIAAAGLTAFAHGVHPWPLPFTLLVVFFIGGTTVTKIKKDIKAGLTMQSTGSAGGEGARTHIQVFANSGIASVLSLLHTYQLSYSSESSAAQSTCYPYAGSLLIIGIIANYAAVSADTFSSELGILSRSAPRLITSWNLRKVPAGTNGGVSLAGTLAGFGGSALIVAAALLTLPFCLPTKDRKFDSAADARLYGGPGWTSQEKQVLAGVLVLWGGLGSLLDSFLGGWFQASVVDKHTGKVIEGEGGKKVLVGKSGQNSMHMKKRAEIRSKLTEGSEDKHAVPARAEEYDAELDQKLGKDGRYDLSKKMRKVSFGDGEPSRHVESGLGLLDNNEVNFLMAATMTVGAMQVAATYWDVPFASIWKL